jgi:hypothetical protein
LGLALGAASAAEAQLTMQMTNGWSFTFAGNVNAFYIYQQQKGCAGSTCATVGKDLSMGTGLLPSFAVFDAKGKEENLDLGVHFGFAPQIQMGNHDASHFGADAAGAQIDMRQVYLTAGGTWGTLTMGKELGLYQRGNILTDMTLLGVGVGGFAPPIGRGTALGRIGFGYLYTDFRPQLTYSTPAGRPTQISIGLFDGLRQSQYTVIQLPRVEAEFNWNGKFGEKNNAKIFINGAAQTAKDGVAGTTNSLSSVGGGGGIVLDFSGFALTGSGFFAKGMGFLLSGDGVVGGNFDNLGVDVAGDGRNSFGYIGQLVYSAPSGKVSVGGSFGENHLKRTDADQTADGTDSEILKNRAIVGQLTYKWSKSLRWVFEYGHFDFYSDGAKAAKTDQGSVGMMLFF